MRGVGIFEYLRNGGGFELASRTAVYEFRCTTHLYNRRQEEISLDEIERIHIWALGGGSPQPSTETGQLQEQEQCLVVQRGLSR